MRRWLAVAVCGVAVLGSAGAMSAPTDVTSLRSPSGGKCDISKHGAHVLSWSPSADAASALYMSPAAKYGANDAIRGGIPICFPQFGPRGDLPQHGFARKNNNWELEESCSENQAVYKLCASDDTRKTAWGHEFECYYTVAVQEDGSLETALRVKNTGDKDFTFTCALHTYFTVGDISGASVKGLKGCTYEDGLQPPGAPPVTEADDAVRFNGEVDRVYGPTPAVLTIDDEVGSRTVTINKENFPDAVVWNPWIEKTKALADMPDEDYHKFVCVEVGAIRQPVTVAAGAEWMASQRLSVMPLK